MTPPASRPAYERLAAVIRDQIVSGELNPGDQLPTESDMCAMQAVSRSTVREALRVLSSQNLVITTRGVSGGSFVVQPEPARIAEFLQTSLGLLTSASGSVKDLLEVRALLEVPAAGIAARRRTRAQLDALRATMFDPRDVDIQSIFTSNRNFHGVLLASAGNPALEAVTQPVFRVLQDRFHREKASSRFWTRVDRDHREILDCVESKDVEGAEQAQAAHLDHLRSTYTRIDRERRRMPPAN